MQTTIKEQLQNTYPPILSLENIRVILRISKRKAAWMLHNGYIKCTINEKKTRNYQIKIEDLFEYIDKAESLDPSIQFPSGLFSSRKTKTHREESSVIAPCIIHQKPSDDFRDWISDEWYDIEEMLPLKDVPKLIGYNEKTIQRWAHQKSLKTVWHQNRLFTTRDWVMSIYNENFTKNT
jgi:hypothetical protein